MSANTNDMSRGKPLKLLLLFTLPMLVSVTFQQLYNIADSVIAGKFLGNDALAAVSASYPITVIFTNIGTGLGVGCSIVCSRAYGEKNYIKLKSAVSTSFISFFIIAAGLTVAAGSRPSRFCASFPRPNRLCPKRRDTSNFTFSEWFSRSFTTRACPRFRPSGTRVFRCIS